MTKSAATEGRGRDRRPAGVQAPAGFAWKRQSPPAAGAGFGKASRKRIPEQLKNFNQNPLTLYLDCGII
jgi:hypothetical protein